MNIFVDDTDDNNVKGNQAAKGDNGKTIPYFGGAYEMNGE
jgi:hypothetical protein